MIKKPKQKRSRPANSQPAAPAPEAKPTEAPVAKAEAKPETPAQPVVDEQAVFRRKNGCLYQVLQQVYRSRYSASLARYADWLKDFKQGPTGEERTVYGIYGISESNLAECEKGVKSAVALTPALQPIDGVAVSYIDAAVALGNTINEMDKYYTQENYKDDAFAKGKTLHQTFLKNLEAFEPVAESYHAAIQEINDKRQLAELKNIEEREGKTFHYYSLAVMISAKQN
ncbi:putative lipoprotein [Escherichia coli]|uniref:Putative lipoprotein n=1 Tax=Escherichia coli TaxID=562 RepID=A0A2X1KDB1_ECOLX|nr:putative lipoprotein [Escherichia coli]